MVLKAAELREELVEELMGIILQAEEAGLS